MRRIFIVMIAGMVFLLVACSRKTTDGQDADRKTFKTEQSDTQQAEANKNAETAGNESAADKALQEAAGKESESAQNNNDYMTEQTDSDYNYDYDGYDYDGYDYDGYDYDGGDYYGDYSYPDYGDYSDGFGGYLCDYGTYIASIETPDGPRMKAYINIYNSNGAMTAEVTVLDINSDGDSLWCYVYTDSTEAFGDASRNTEVELDMRLDDPNFSYSHDFIAGGRLEATVYWPGEKCHFKLTCGNGTVYEYTGYPD